MFAVGLFCLNPPPKRSRRRLQGADVISKTESDKVITRNKVTGNPPVLKETEETTGKQMFAVGLFCLNPPPKRSRRRLQGAGVISKTESDKVITRNKVTGNPPVLKETEETTGKQMFAVGLFCLNPPPKRSRRRLQGAGVISKTESDKVITRSKVTSNLRK
jgi:16S rRNA U516 pseudouridylate synthase RsuA-like enzyme